MAEGDILRRDNDTMRYAVQQLDIAQGRIDRCNQEIALLSREKAALEDASGNLHEERDSAVKARDEMTAERNFFKRKAGSH